MFNAICGIGIGIGVCLLFAFHTWLEWSLYPSNLLVVALITSWNFGMNTQLNWNCRMNKGQKRVNNPNMLIKK